MGICGVTVYYAGNMWRVQRTTWHRRSKAHAQAWHFSSRSCNRLAVRMGSWVPKTLSEALPEAKCSFPVCPGICCNIDPFISKGMPALRMACHCTQQGVQICNCGLFPCL